MSCFVMASSTEHVIVVDDRQPTWHPGALSDLGLISVVDHMEFGDYSFYPHGLTALIEAKTISDLLGSMASKRLVAQAHGIVANSDIAFLLREGAFQRGIGGGLEYHSPRHPKARKDGWVESGWDWNSFNGIMLDLQMMGIRMLDCPVMGSVPEELARLVISLSKDEHKWIKERTRPEVVTIDKQYRNAVWSLCAFDGIGPEIAEGLLNEYDSISNLMSALNSETWGVKQVANTTINGRKFGLKRAEKLREEVMQEWK